MEKKRMEAVFNERDLFIYLREQIIFPKLRCAVVVNVIGEAYFC